MTITEKELLETLVAELTKDRAILLAACKEAIGDLEAEFGPNRAHQNFSYLYRARDQAQRPEAKGEPMSGLYIDIVEPLDDQIAKLKRDNAALLAAAKGVVKEARSRYVVYPKLEQAIAQAEAES